LANIENGKLVFVVDAPVWRSKLRLAAPELLDAARSFGLDAQELVVKTTLVSAPAQARGKPPLPMSPAARTALQSALASLEEPAEKSRDDAPWRKRK